MLARVAAELPQRLGRAGADGVGGDADADPVRAERLELVEVVGDRRLAEPGDAAAEVAGMEQRELDPGFRGGLSGGAALRESQIVELADRGVAVRAQLP